MAGISCTYILLFNDSQSSKGYAKFWDKIGFRREKLEGYEQILTGDLAGKKMSVAEWKEELIKYVQKKSDS